MRKFFSLLLTMTVLFSCLITPASAGADPADHTLSGAPGSQTSAPGEGQTSPTPGEGSSPTDGGHDPSLTDTPSDGQAGDEGTTPPSGENSSGENNTGNNLLPGETDELSSQSGNAAKAQNAGLRAASETSILVSITGSMTAPTAPSKFLTLPIISCALSTIMFTMTLALLPIGALPGI